MARKAAIYARVSTEHEAQISALENQVQYYDELLQRHPDWELVDRYIDEGITGTSIHKRESFMRMLQDAKEKKFDLIITREVSRFARNTVDTLQQTRIFKSYGVEVWFTEDNIWTMNDEDGELRLSIMAMLDQNESKKISQRVKAGQMISFKNGVLYGNGNILGYDRVGDKLVVNKEQAETVKRIFELYLSGNGVRIIQDIMEQEGRKTATGLTRWQSGNINRVLRNPFYCGRIVYRKQYVPDYLVQKKINNFGAVEKVYVEGTHEKLVSPEDFDRAQELRAKHRIGKRDKNGRSVGQSSCKHIWGNKFVCTCGHAMNRRIAHKARLGNIGVGRFIDDDKSYISPEHYERLKKYTCKSGEIIIGTLGEPNLRACIVPEVVGVAINKADCVHYIPKSEILNNDFVCQYINCPETLLLAKGMIHGQTRSRVSSGQIAQMPIFVPPIDLQRDFSEFMSQTDKSKVAVQKALDEAQQLFDSLMQEYFG